MRQRRPALGMLALALLTLCCAPQKQTCTVAFQLNHYDKPFADEGLAIFSVVDGKISLAAAKMLGSGQTDAKGAASMDFACGGKDAKYVIAWLPKGKCCGMLRHSSNALGFSCGQAGPRCDLGKLTFEVFEF